jgi:DNA topoisomerase-1
VLAATALVGLDGFTTKAQARKNIVRAVESVAHKLGNTVAVCRKCYVHPAVFEGYLDGTLAASLNGTSLNGANLNGAVAGPLPSAAAELRPDEAKVLAYLRHRAAGQRQAGRAGAATTTKKAA